MWTSNSRDTLVGCLLNRRRPIDACGTYITLDRIMMAMGSFKQDNLGEFLEAYSNEMQLKGIS